MQLIDTHTHLYADAFAPDRDHMLQRAFAAGVNTLLMPNVDQTSVEGMMALEDRHPQQCRAMMGVHPCSIGADFEQELAVAESWLGRRPFVAVGEIGLDYYWSTEFAGQQQEAFRVQVGWAKRLGLPVVIHCRNSFADTAGILEALGTDGLTGVFHCFTGTLAEAERAVALGFKLGIGGVATFKNGGLDAVLPHLALTDLVLETDSPYLAPVPHRGKRNETAYLPLVARRLADLLHLPLETVAETTTRTAKALFRL